MVISAPSDASANVTGTSSVRLLPARPNSRCGLTETDTYRSPAAPPFSPAAPLPLSLMRWPSFTPAGIRTCIVLAERPRPDPSQSGQGVSTIRPRPRHSVQGSLSWNTPPD